MSKGGQQGNKELKSKELTINKKNVRKTYNIINDLTKGNVNKTIRKKMRILQRILPLSPTR